MIEARIHLPTPPGLIRYNQLMALADTLADANAFWFGQQLNIHDALLAQGKLSTKPPCCIGCVEPGIKYRPPPPGSQQVSQHWWSAPDVLKRGKATCLGAAAFDVGAARAKGKHAYVELEPQGEEMVDGDAYSTLDYHAVAIIDGERVDSTQKLTHGQCSCGSCPG